MVQIKTIVAGLLSLSIATCHTIVRRDAALVLSDLASIDTALDDLSAAITAYEGGLAGALDIATAEATLDAAINQATADANASDAFSPTDSTSVVAAVAALTPKIQDGLVGLILKESLFDADGLNPIVLSLLQTLQTDTAALGVAIRAKAQSTDVPTLQTYQDEIDASFAFAIAAFQ
ncbi:hydrophobic surface binding protein A-domain-containing protein [Bisporella sp. PMI_857]|nr:hydrophobic surface binding protein A-domain-containing protein [Bisporella sp. PMI_857]